MFRGSGVKSNWREPSRPPSREAQQTWTEAAGKRRLILFGSHPLLKMAMIRYF